MDIKLSPKFKPLFDLLRTREVMTSDKWETMTPERKKYFKSLSKVDTVVNYGSRDSGKTFGESVFVPVAVSDYNHRVLYTRFAMNTTDQSISMALSERIGMLGLGDAFDYANNTYYCKHNEGKIFITGQRTSSKNQTAKLKSLENFSMFITDEAEEITNYDDWDTIRKSIRAQDVQCICMLVFNPPTREHFLWTEFFEDMGVEDGFSGIVENVLYIHTTYLDNIDNMAEHNIKAYEKLRINHEIYTNTPVEEREQLPAKIKKDYRKYRSVGLGLFKDTEEGVIYEDWEIGEFDDTLPFVYGMDFGHADPDALCKVAADHGQKLLYIDECYYQNNTGLDPLSEILLQICEDGVIFGDYAERRLIHDLQDRGVNIEKCKKGKVARRIRMVQGYKLVFTPRSVNAIKSARNYVWKHSAAGVPNHEWSHLPNAWEYAAMELLDY